MGNRDQARIGAIMITIPKIRRTLVLDFFALSQVLLEFQNEVQRNIFIPNRRAGTGDTMQYK